MKKVDGLFQRFGAKATLLVGRDGLTYAYQSHADSPPIVSGYLFDRRMCLGPQIAELTIPPGAPDGAALLFWYISCAPILAAELTFY